jgi:hypothetical protein
MAGDLFYILYQISGAVGFIPWEDSFFQMKVLQLAALVTVGAVVGAFMRNKEKTFLVLAALYIATLTAGIGSFTLPHLLFALPIWIALILYGLREEIGERWVIVNIGIIPLVFQFIHATAYTEERLQEPIFKEQAALIDGVLEKCGIERYMIADPALAEIAAFTKHSPWEISYGMNHFDLTEEWKKTEVAVGLESTLIPEGFTDESDCKPEEKKGLRFFFR